LADPSHQLIRSTGASIGFTPDPGDKGKPITVIATPAIRETLKDKCIEQALNSRGAPGSTDLVLNPDAHCRYGAPLGCAVVEPGAEKSCYSVNHGAGRRKGRKATIREFHQQCIDSGFDNCDILSEVLRSVALPGLAKTVAHLKVRFVIKDSDLSLKGSSLKNRM